MTLNESSTDYLSITAETIKSESEISEDEQQELESDGSNKETDDEQSNNVNSGWVDSVTKILKTKKPKGKRSIVLSKAKKLTDLKIGVERNEPQKIGFEIEGEIKEEKPDIKIKEESKTLKKENEVNEPVQNNKRMKFDWNELRSKPTALDKDRERTLTKIATRGVVQLFNSVRMQQKDIGKKLDEVGSLEGKRQKVLKSIDKRSFLDVLMKKKSESVDGNVKNDEDDRNDKRTTWNVLKDDFMMGAKLKDWDKVQVENESEQVEELSDSESDS